MKTRWLFPVMAVLAAILSLMAPAASGASGAPHTLMVYMVGSDLESDGGMASADMAEIASAARDESMRVLLYAGGASRWQSEVPEGKNGVFLLEGGEWKLVREMPEENMGSPETLSGFLRVGCERFPESSFGLVLWDHGSGPMVGYGQDENYDRDRLTLPELRDALANSPFSESNKLEWVGFDACLMGSAETAHVLSGYARYMIASQEAEPNEGWNYAFLKDIRPGDSGETVGRLACDAYLAESRAQYREFPEYAPPVTLSCLDLARVRDVETRMDALGERMNRELTLDRYIETTRRRMALNDFGRFTTGSEYDLVDLQTLARALSGFYPEQTAALLEAVDGMVVYNSANIKEAGGVSIYYPFYNKAYYRGSWQREYIDLGFSPGYTGYLQQYSRIWLGERLSGQESDLESGSFLEDGYAVQLTPEQIKTYGRAFYYILRRGDGETYQLISFSKDVERQPGGLIKANFDGRTLFCFDAATGEAGGVIASVEYARDERFATYTVPAEFVYLAHGEVVDLDNKTVSVSIQVKVDLTSGHAEILGIVPSAEDGALSTGKQQKRMAGADRVRFINGLRYKTYTPEGRLLPYTAWQKAGRVEGFDYASTVAGNAGVEFRLQDVSKSTRDLYLMFVVEDVQGNFTAFEPTPVHIQPEAEPTPPASEANLVKTLDLDVLRVDQPVPLLNEKGVEAALTGVEPNAEYSARLKLRITNHADKRLVFHADGASVNDFMMDMNFSLPGSMAFGVALDPGQTADAVLGVSIDKLKEIRQSAVRSIEFSLYATAPGEFERLLEAGPLQIRTNWDLSESVGPLPAESPGLIQPVIYEMDGVRFSLLSARTVPGSGDLSLSTEVENPLEYAVTARVENVSIDGFMMPNTFLDCMDLPPGKRRLTSIVISGGDLERARIKSPDEMEFRLALYAAGTRDQLFRSDVLNLPFKASTDAAGPEITAFDQDGVRITLRQVDTVGDPDAAFRVRLCIENRNSFDVRVQLDDQRVNGIPTYFYVDSGYAAAGKTCLGDVSVSAEALSALGIDRAESIQMRLQLVDAEREQLISYADTGGIPLRRN